LGGVEDSSSSSGAEELWTRVSEMRVVVEETASAATQRAWDDAKQVGMHTT
jgi:hypothetical protein